MSADTAPTLGQHISVGLLFVALGIWWGLTSIADAIRERKR